MPEPQQTMEQYVLRMQAWLTEVLQDYTTHDTLLHRLREHKADISRSIAHQHGKVMECTRQVESLTGSIMAIRASVDNACDRALRVETASQEFITTTTAQEMLAREVVNLQANIRRSEDGINQIIAHHNGRFNRIEASIMRILRFLEVQVTHANSFHTATANRQDALRNQLVNAPLQPLGNPGRPDHNMQSPYDFR